MFVSVSACVCVIEQVITLPMLQLVLCPVLVLMCMVMMMVCPALLLMLMKNDDHLLCAVAALLCVVAHAPDENEDAQPCAAAHPLDENEDAQPCAVAHTLNENVDYLPPCCCSCPLMKMQILCHLAVPHALDDDDCALFLL